MNGMKKIEDKLTIVIATYNRAKLLAKTLSQLTLSPIKDCKIVVQNNHSTDETEKVFNSFKTCFSNFHLVTHPINIGGNANLIRSSEYCTTEYMWILADDDEYSFEGFNDVIDAMFSNKYDVIQVGAHCDKEWEWGIEGTPKELIAKGYNFFKYSSFLPCSIFRTSFFNRHIINAYRNIAVSYIHMASLLSAYKENRLIYLSKKRIVCAVMGNQGYNNYVPIRGFSLLSIEVDSRKEKHDLIVSQYGTNNLAKCYLIWNYRKFIPNTVEGRIVNKLIFDACSLIEKLYIISAYIPMRIASLVNSHR